MISKLEMKNYKIIFNSIEDNFTLKNQSQLHNCGVNREFSCRPQIVTES